MPTAEGPRRVSANARSGFHIGGTDPENSRPISQLLIYQETPDISEVGTFTVLFYVTVFAEISLFSTSEKLLPADNGSGTYPAIQ